MMNCMQARWIVGVCCVAACALSSSAAAQTATVPAPPVRWHLPVTPGQAVVVTSTDGTRVKGRVAGYGDTSIQIAVKKRTLKFAAADVRAIESPDSVVNGAVWGALTIGLFGGMSANSCLAPDCKLIAESQGKTYVRKNPNMEFLKGAAIGAVVGAAIDYMWRRHKIYERR